MDIRIRPYGDADFSAILPMEQEGRRSEYGAAVFIRQSAALFPRTFLIADVKGQATGFTVGALAQDGSGEAWVLRLFVKSEYRSRGIGALLMEHVTAALFAERAKAILLSVSPQNTAALEVYRKLGFEKVTHSRGYFGVGEDRDIMRLVG